MPYRSKKKRYRIKPLPVLIAIILVVAIFILAIFIFNGGAEQNPAPPSSSKSSSSLPPSSENSSDEPQSSSDPSAEKTSSDDIIETGGEGSRVKSSNSTSSKATSSETPNNATIGSADDGIWNLMLIRRGTQLKADLAFEKTKFDTQYVDSRAAPAYKSMYNAAKKEGITLYLRSGYRSIATQKTNYNNEIQRYINLGNSKEEATRLTELYYTRPGDSEHHTGLAFDIITPEYHRDVYTLNEKFADTKAYEWLINNCAEYGFIERYPKSKKDITDINWEPWHYRYVGVEHAKYIMENGLCLEEYIQDVMGR